MNTIDNQSIMQEKEITETYHFQPSDFDIDGRRKSDGVTFRDLVKDFERDFHKKHSTEYALNLYGNSQTMLLLEKSCDAAPFLKYGMDMMSERHSFDAEEDPFVNHEMDKHSEYIIVYGIDSTFMTFDKNGCPLLSEDGDVFPLTLLIDDSMQDNAVRLATPTTDGDEPETVIVDVPKFEIA